MVIIYTYTVFGRDCVGNLNKKLAKDMKNTGKTFDIVVPANKSFGW